MANGNSGTLTIRLLPRCEIYRKLEQTRDIIIFVSGKKSSNGRMLFQSCKDENENSYFISDVEEIDEKWFLNAKSVGICGATSTPRWLMENVQDSITKLNLT